MLNIRTLLAVAFVAAAVPADAQPAPTGTEATIAAAAAEHSDVGTAPPATLTFANRSIVEFRASSLGHSPAERAASVHAALDRLVDQRITGPVEIRPVGALIAFRVGGRDTFMIVPGDVDALAGETLESTAAFAAARLRTALEESDELRRPRQLLAGVLQALVATAAFILILWGLLRVTVSAGRRLAVAAARGVGAVPVVVSERIVGAFQGLVSVVTWTVGLLAGYSWLTFVLRRFPYTRPWGESLRARLLARLAEVGSAVLGALPGLLTILVIIVATRVIIAVVRHFFRAVEDGRLAVHWLYPETAQLTRQLVTAGLWACAAVMAYPYIPGSGSDAFKGISVFVGLLLSLGSSGSVNQITSGLTLIYSRALRPGDYVSVGDVEGTVAQIGSIATKLRTPIGEDVTIPNAVVVSQVVTNYSRLATEGGVFVPTEVTIGYDAPWRQVEALLLLAAARTPGIRREPAPFVRQASLEDPYVRYRLLVSPERPADRRAVMAAVHANIQDAFNEFGVQIMSPRYVLDPAQPKIVPREGWYAAPASPDPKAAPPGG
jgi:small-conductance mechanosensitive channel